MHLLPVMPFGRYLYDLTVLLCLLRKPKVGSSYVSHWGSHKSIQAHNVSLKNKQTTNNSPQHCQKQKITRIFSEFLLSLEVQIFSLISPIVRTFRAKSINCRFMCPHFPSTQNKMNPYHIRISRICFPMKK